MVPITDPLTASTCSLSVPAEPVILPYTDQLKLRVELKVPTWSVHTFMDNSTSKFYTVPCHIALSSE